ncbi:Metacaspase-1 [Diplonema papillatum]|nr:Metacaspase-1 [Diplonema papillatum]|eukprot:gene22760-34862_t
MPRFFKKLAAKAEGALGKLSHSEQKDEALSGNSEADYEDATRAACPADVFMFSGCMDKQTSADVSNVQSFGLPSGSGPSGAGGACTNALLAQAYEPGKQSWVKVLTDMSQFLSSKGYSQVPVLSTSRKTDLNSEHFYISPPKYTGRKYAVLIGINYKNHSQGKLSGCVNDVLSMKDYICKKEGFSEDSAAMRVLVDDSEGSFRGSVQKPTKANILAACQWLGSVARAGDSLFFHYSGHGGQQKDTSGDEEDGMDETLIPEDYQSAGVITDDVLFETLVAGIPSGVHMTCVLDCCHSGTILDLPFTFVADKQGLSTLQTAASTGSPFYTHPNPQFNAIIQKMLKMGGDVLCKKYPQLTPFVTKFLQGGK